MNESKVIDWMVGILKTYSNEKIFPVETPQGESMKERWATHKNSGNHFGYLKKIA